MRLIDADKLPYVSKVILVDELDGDIIITIAKEYTSYVNDETPTVKAIPIEWIEKWEQRDENYFLFMDLTKKLIEDWEKEQSESLE